MAFLLALTAFILIITSSISVAGNRSPFAGIHTYDVPTAAVFGSEAVLLNPAGLFLNKPFSLQGIHSFDKGDFSGDNAFLFSASGAGFGYQRISLGLPYRVSRYDIAMSSRVLRNVYTGLSYTYYRSDWGAINKAHSWNYSLLGHLGKIASVAAQMRNINKQRFDGVESPVEYIFGAAIRPLGDRFTIGGDLTLLGDESLKDAGWRISTKVHLREGLSLIGGYDDREFVGVGLELQFGNTFGGSEGFLRDGKYRQGTIYGGYTAAPREEVVIHDKVILHLDLSGEIPEEPSSGFLFSSSKETMYRKLAKIREAANDPRIKGLLVTIRNPEIGLGKYSDLRREILNFKRQGKPVIAYLGVSPRNGAYYLASAADKIFMLPVDALYLTGLRAEVTFYKGTLDKLDIEPQIEKAGEYKNYPNLLTDSTLTPPHREALESLIDDLYEQIIDEIAVGREFAPAMLKQVIDKGPFTSIQAESLRLVDGRMYPEQLQENLTELFEGKFKLLSMDQYRNHSPFREEFGEPDRIAVVTIAGGITTGDSGSSLFAGKTAGSRTITAALRRMKNDPSVKGIVLRLDTPGGDAIASDLIWAEATDARRQKPVVVSMSDVCASGGYYIATAADEIMLEPCTVTGSIGVFAGKANLAGLYSKMGMRTEVITRGKHANMFSMKSGYSEEERDIVRRQVDDLYGNFLTLVADSRKISRDSADAISRGRVWSGKMALKIGLADRQGTLLDAIESAAARGGLEEGAYEVLELPERKQRFWNLTDIFIRAFTEVFSLDFLGLSNAEPLTQINQFGATTQMRLPYGLVID